MDAITVIKNSLAMADMVSQAYLADLTDPELLKRPHPECNHINWQIGHIVASEHEMVSAIAPGKMPPLPEGFADIYSKDAAKSEDTSKFLPKATLMETFAAQRAATLEVLSQCSADELDQPSGVEYAPTKADIFALQGTHWLMHCGQWVPIRRDAGKPIVM